MSDLSSAGAAGNSDSGGAAGEVHDRFRSAFQYAGVGMCLTAPDGSFLEVNHALRDMLGYTEDEMTSRDFASITHPDDLAISRECIRCLLARERTSYRFEKRYLHRNGGIVWADVSTSLCRDETGAPRYFITQVQDITERKHMADELRQTQQLLSSFVEHAPTPMYVTETDSRYRFVNPAWEGLTGARQDEVAGKTIEEVSGPAFAERFDNCVRRVVQSGQPMAVDETAEGPGGTCHYQTVIFPLPGDGDDVAAIGAVTADVTGLRQAEASLRESEERFRTAFKHAPIGMSLTAIDGTLLRVNLALCRMLGRTQDELIGGNMASISHPDDVAASIAWMRHVVESGEDVCRFEKRFVHSDGHIVVAEVNSFLLRDSEGCPLHFITHLLDVTDRRQAEQDLQSSERRFREMTDLLPDMVVELDLGLRATYINRAVTQVLGYTEADVEQGFGMADVVDDETLARATADVSDALAGGEPVQRAYDLICKDGRIIPVEVHATGIANSEGELTGFRGVLRDLTERQKVEDSQRLAALGQLSAGVAHEYNNLMAVLMLQADLAAADRTIKRYDDLVTTALRVATHGEDISRGLTAFARPGAPLREPLHVETVIDAALALAANHIDNSGVIVTRDYRTDGHRVFADGRQLEQVFVNILVNACHAMPRSGKLTVETRYVTESGRAGEVVVRVHDTGTGIEPEHLPHVFEPFFTTKGRLGGSDVSGTGLGLSVSHGIVRAHGGTITVRSKVDVGTTLELVLPACDALASMQVPHEEPSRAKTAGQVRRKARILLADRVELVATLITRILTGVGYQVDYVHTTDAAISALQAVRYDLVITDLLMPGGGGAEVVGFANSCEEPPPVLVITGSQEVWIEQDALAMGAAAGLHKPFSSAQLIETVEELLAAKQG